MKITTIIGVILIALGIISLVLQGITYTTHEKVINLGPIHATAEEKKTIPLHPIFGAILLVSGVVLLVTGRRNA